MKTDAEEVSQQAENRPSFLLRTHLFDSYGVPWTARLSLGWSMLAAVLSGLLLGPPIGLYLGIWLVARRRAPATLLIYLALLACLFGWYIPAVPHRLATIVGCAAGAMALWFIGAFTLRYQVMKLYWEVDRTDLHLSYLRTALFGVWYVNYQLRPMWPV